MPDIYLYIEPHLYPEWLRVVTPQEMKVRKVFYEMNIPIETEMVFCFRCTIPFKSDTERPEVCLNCLSRYDDYSMYCKPDILLKSPLGQIPAFPPIDDMSIHTMYGVIRVDDENLHKKNKKHRMHDYNQTELLEERRVKVFILYNEEVDDYYPWRLHAIARFFWECLTNEELYRLYRNDKDIIQRFSK